MRLNRFLAAAGIGSRRHCDELIAAGRVTINGQACADFSVQPTERDHVKVDGKLVHPERPLYILLHKPAGFVSTRQDPHACDTIFDLLPAKFPRLFHVGRLDAQSEGLIVLTNDGDFAQKLTHPRHKIEKEYEVTLDHRWDPALTPKLLHGVFLEGDRAKLSRLQQVGLTRVRVVLRQGINRQIRRMFYEMGYEVKRLVRTRIGNLRLGDLPRGHWRMMTRSEVAALRATEKLIHFRAQNFEGRRIADATTREKADQNREPGHRRRSHKQRPERRSVGQFENKYRQRPTR
jgi:23S rRNA pseudouridine2605 synthase